MMPSFRVNKIRGYTSISIIIGIPYNKRHLDFRGLTILVHIKEGCNMHQITLQSASSYVVN